MENVVIGIAGMSCQNCVKSLTGVLQALPGVARVEVSLEDGRATLAYDPDRIAVAQFNEAIERAGFDVS